MPDRQPIRLDRHVVDLNRRALLDAASGQPVELRPQALELLCLLAEHAGEVVDKRLATERVWPGMVVTDDSLVQAIGDIRRALGDARHAVVQTVPRRGYRLIAAGASDRAPTPLDDPPAAAVTARRLRPLPALALALLLVAAVAAAAVAWRETSRSPVERLTAPKLAVLAFRSESPEAADSLLGHSVAEELIGDLARNIDVPVVSGRSSFQLDLQKLPAQEIARRLRVRYLVDGSVRRSGDELAIRAQLIDGEDGRIVWTHEARSGVAQWAAARSALVDRMAGSVRVSLWRSETQRARAAHAPASLDAYTLATRAYANKHQFNGPAYRDGRAAAERAIQLDPNYAFAWAALGYLNSLDAGNNFTGEWPPSRRGEALAQIERALQLDPELPLAHQARAVTLRMLARVPEALRAAETAVRLAPGDADNLAILAWVQATAGRTDAAVATIEKALTLYPIAPVYVNLFEAEVLWAARDNAAALAAIDRCVERAPRYAICRISRAIVLFELARLDEARRDSALYRELQPNASRASFGTFAAAPELHERRMKAADALGFAPAP